MHTDDTLGLLDCATTALGTEFRKFSNVTCPSFDTRELRRESEARTRRELKKKAANTETAQSTAPPLASSEQSQRRRKTFNLRTYKYHALGDYANTIRRYGTTDSYTTEIVRNFSHLMWRRNTDA